MTYALARDPVPTREDPGSESVTPYRLVELTMVTFSKSCHTETRKWATILVFSRSQSYSFGLKREALHSPGSHGPEHLRIGRPDYHDNMLLLAQ